MTRGEAIHRLKNTAWLGTDKDREETEQAVDMAIEALADRPTGKWICMGDVGVTECNQCGWSIEEYVGDYKFCPNCGAKMNKGGGSE